MLSDLFVPAAIPAVIAAVSGAVIFGLTQWANHKLAKMRFRFDQELAEKKFDLDVKLADQKRRQDFAILALTTFHEINDGMKSVRARFFSASESPETPFANLTPKQQREHTRDLIIKRLKRHSDKIASLTALQYQSIALFGKDGAQPFHEFFNALNKFHMFLDDYIELDDRDILVRIRKEIFGGYGDDEVGLGLKASLEKIEALCRPILEKP